jgi:hypothetical protein
MTNPGWGTAFTSPLGFMVRHNQRMVHTWSGLRDSRNVDNGNTAINYDDGLGNGLLDPDQYFLLGGMVADYDFGLDDSGLVPYAMRFNVFDPVAQPVEPGGTT